MSDLFESPSQTAGPYVHIGCLPSLAGLALDRPDPGGVMVRDGAKGEAITIEGQVFDGAGAPLRDGMVEIWQADADGLFNSPAEWRGAADPAFSGWGRSATDPDTGLFHFNTIKPGRVPLPDGRLQAPHISLWIVARGINLGLSTRIYFADEAQANAVDPVLARVEQASHRDTLTAVRDGEAYRFDVHLQGPKETVFFDV